MMMMKIERSSSSSRSRRKMELGVFGDVVRGAV
jgi:hypothetical protein